MRRHDKVYSIEKLRDKVLYYINYRPRSLQEVKKKLNSLNATLEQEELLLKELLGFGLINDEKIIELYIQQFINSKLFSLYKTKLELQKKGFDKELIAEKLNEYLDEEEFSEEDQVWQTLSQKYRYSIPDREKVIAFLVRRGFSYHISKKVSDEFIKKHTF
ncbi:MAG: regulatory protein RecX [Brevinema sp.]